ncbi:hypothetical protein [Kribbella sindirgiensis]|uniref:hypothetical protein n=1 Tax=Kribbella sindirgiensis TaxID=1124744 RepID=UPI00192D8A2B|nr:hypothetical protein [Kribbella sindirgiensis]
MSHQRRRGQKATIWRTITITDNRGNEVKVADEANPWIVKAWEIPQRSAKAEVPGQQKINIIRLGVQANLEGVELWSRVVFKGKPYDVVTPPAYHHGSSRHVRHWSIDIRERPNHG